MKKIMVVLLTLVSIVSFGAVAFAQLPVASTCNTTVGRVDCAPGQGGSCSPFDFETWSGYCATPKGVQGAIFSICNCPDTATNFRAGQRIGVRMTILVNDKSAAEQTTPLGAYWADPAATNTGIIEFGKFVTIDQACNGGYGFSFGTGHYYKSTLDLTPTGYANTAAGTTCAVAAANRATVYVTDRSAGYLITTQDEVDGVARWRVNIPPIRIDPNVLHNGETIKVKVEFLLQTGGGICTDCPPICEGTIIVARVCCADTVGGCFFPYFTATSAVTPEQPYWNGIAIINKGTTAGVATLNFYQQDGATGTFTTPSIPGGSMFVSALENIDIQTTSGTLGGLPVYVSVTSNFSAIDGFAMMSNSDTGDSMGYLCRQ